VTSREKDVPINKDDLENFLRQVSTLSEVVENHSQLVAHFGYYLTEKLGETDVTPKRIRACYDAASIPAPANITDTMQKSHAFVRTSNGTTLNRDARTRIKNSIQISSRNEEGVEEALPREGLREKARTVVVVHGRDFKLRDSMFQFLRSAGLAPIEWNEAVRRTRRGAPYTGEIVDALFRDAQAIVVILSPDERVELRNDLQSEDSADNSGWQPRPNVFIEAGMALARDEAHTVLVEIGTVRHASDLVGRNSIRFDGSSTHRHDLIERLRTACCAVSTSGSDWLRVGDFGIPPRNSSESGRRSK
jgi:predicted nucleotide-binding protein